MTLRVDQRCENCWCFEPSETARTGECRRYAPRPHLNDEEDYAKSLKYGWWPLVDGDEWCAEWSPKDREE